MLFVQVPLPGSQLSLSTYGSGAGQPLLALPHTPPQAQPSSMGRQPPVSQAYRNMMGHNPGMMQPPTSKVRPLAFGTGAGRDLVIPYHNYF